MAFCYSSDAAKGMLNGTGLAEFIGGSGKMKIYAGTVPASADAGAGTLLATLNLAATPFSGFTDPGTAARATLGTVAPATVATTGTAAYWRIESGAGAVACQGEAGATGSGKEAIFGSVAFTAGSTVTVSSGTIDQPKGP